MEKRQKKYEELTIIDDFMFGKVMRDPERCRKLLEIILGMKIRKIVFLEDQDSINPDYRAKGIRLDIFAEDRDNAVYSVEMQAENTGVLPERSRYYQSVIDISLLEKGASYKALKKSYIIFICTFDLFARGRHIYHFENLCREDPSIRLSDGAEKIFLNASGTTDDIDESLKNLLVYFKSRISQDDFTRDIDRAVIAAREHREWRREYMKLTLWEQDIKEAAQAEGWGKGLEEGRAAGRAEGEIKTLTDQVCRKIARGKSIEAIAEELETDTGKIQRIYDVAVKYGPDYDREKIFAELQSKYGTN